VRAGRTNHPGAVDICRLERLDEGLPRLLRTGVARGRARAAERHLLPALRRAHRSLGRGHGFFARLRCRLCSAAAPRLTVGPGPGGCKIHNAQFPMDIVYRLFASEGVATWYSKGRDFHHLDTNPAKHDEHAASAAASGERLSGVWPGGGRGVPAAACAASAGAGSARPGRSRALRRGGMRRACVHAPRWRPLAGPRGARAACGPRSAAPRCRSPLV